MPNYFIEIATVIDNSITGHIVTLGGLKLGDGKWLQKSSMDIEQLRAALMESCPDRLAMSELAYQQKLQTLKLKLLGSEAAIAPPLEDFAAGMKDERWRLRE